MGLGLYVVILLGLLVWTSVWAVLLRFAKLNYWRIEQGANYGLISGCISLALFSMAGAHFVPAVPNMAEQTSGALEMIILWSLIAAFGLWKTA